MLPNDGFVQFCHDGLRCGSSIDGGSYFFFRTLQQLLRDLQAIATYDASGSPYDTTAVSKEQPLTAQGTMLPVGALLSLASAHGYTASAG